MTAKEIINKLNKYVHTDLKFKYEYMLFTDYIIEEIDENEDQSISDLIDVIKEAEYDGDMRLDTNYEKKRYIYINDIIIKDGYLEFI